MVDEVRCSTLSHIRTMRTFTLARQWHREAWSLLHGPLKWWFLPAAALTLALSALGWWGISALALSVADAVVNRMAPEHEAGWAKVALEWLVWLVLLAVKLKLTKYIVLVVMGPLFAAVSEAVEAQIRGHNAPFSLRRWIRDTLRGMRSAVWLALFEWTVVALLWIVGLLVPVLSPFTLTLAWLVGAWAYGASVMDYVWERQGKGALSGWRSSLRRLDVAFACGVPFSLWMSIPVLAWTVGPLMGGMGATAAASVALIDREDRQPATT